MPSIKIIDFSFSCCEELRVWKVKLIHFSNGIFSLSISIWNRFEGNLQERSKRARFISIRHFSVSTECLNASTFFAAAFRFSCSALKVHFEWMNKRASNWEKTRDRAEIKTLQRELRTRSIAKRNIANSCMCEFPPRRRVDGNEMAR